MSKLISKKTKNMDRSWMTCRAQCFLLIKTGPITGHFWSLILEKGIIVINVGNKKKNLHFLSSSKKELKMLVWKRLKRTPGEWGLYWENESQNAQMTWNLPNISNASATVNSFLGTVNIILTHSCFNTIIFYMSLFMSGYNRKLLLNYSFIKTTIRLN